MRLQSVCDKFVHTVLAVLPYRKGHGTFTKFVDVEERTIESQRQQLLTIKVSSNISRLRNEQQLGCWGGIIRPSVLMKKLTQVEVQYLVDQRYNHMCRPNITIGKMHARAR